MDGWQNLNRNLEKLRKEIPNKVARKALAKVGKQSVSIIKATIPGKYKSVRKAIGFRQLKLSANAGQPGIKIGAGVDRQRKATTTKNRRNRPGVGIDGRNVHWWFLGTDERFTGTKRIRVGGRRGKGGVRGSQRRVDTGKMKASRGRMDAQGIPISVVLRAASGQIEQTLRTWVGVGLKEEAGKLRK
jgi:hypothetical protein